MPQSAAHLISSRHHHPHLRFDILRPTTQQLHCSRVKRGACSAALPGDKVVWLQTTSKDALLAALEGGLSTAVFLDLSTAAAWAGLASYRQLVLQPAAPIHDASSSTVPRASHASHGSHDILEKTRGLQEPMSEAQASGTPATAAAEGAERASTPGAHLPGSPRANQAASGFSRLIDAQNGTEVAHMHPLRGPEDLQRLMALVAAYPPTGEHTIIMDASDWKIIPAENLVALAQACPGLQLLATAHTCQDALTMLGALEVGTHGVLLRSEDPSEVRSLLAAMREAAAGQLPLQRARVTRVTPVGLGDRVCVDLTCLLAPGEGLLVGSFARGMFLVHSECVDSEYIASRPFRVNAGAVHSYVLGSNGRTAYLSELRSSSPVTVVGPGGITRTARVGRCKLETRPMVLVEACTPDGGKHDVILQNAETVKLVGWAQADSKTLQSGQHDLTITLGAGDETDVNEGGATQGASRDKIKQIGGGGRWQALSVAELKVGDEVLVHCPPGAARHTGVAIREWVIER